ncbi:Peptidyl-prolyl cis-trans isomerase fkbp14, partial [Halocaridina rubra]
MLAIKTRDALNPYCATLVFEVELISIGDAPPVVNVFKQIDSDKDEHLSKEEVRNGHNNNDDDYNEDYIDDDYYGDEDDNDLLLKRQSLKAYSVVTIYPNTSRVKKIERTSWH